MPATIMALMGTSIEWARGSSRKAEVDFKSNQFQAIVSRNVRQKETTISDAGDRKQLISIMSADMLASWDDKYDRDDTPWDTGRPTLELARVIDEGLVRPCRTFELGCGTGTNAVYLSVQRFDVTAADCSGVALSRAYRLAVAEGVSVQFLEANLFDLRLQLEPFDFLFDRSYYEFARKLDLPGFISTVRRLTKPRSKFLLLAGNADDRSLAGPPGVCAHEIRDDWGELFGFVWIRPCRVERPGGSEDSLRWSCLMTRRANQAKADSRIRATDSSQSTEILT